MSWGVKLRMARAETRFEGDFAIVTFHGEGGEIVEITGYMPQWVAVMRGGDTSQKPSARERFLAGEITVEQFERDLVV